MGNATIHHLNLDGAIDLMAVKEEKALIRNAIEGDRGAYRQLVEDNRQRMLAVARSVLLDIAVAEDAVQEAFIKAYRALPEFRGDSRISTWLFKITYLTALDLKRQQVRHMRNLVAMDPDQEPADSGPASRSEVDVERRQMQTMIDQALVTLTEFELSVFSLRHFQNFKVREIARVIDRSEGTVKNILFRAIQKLRNELSKLESGCTELSGSEQNAEL